VGVRKGARAKKVGVCQDLLLPRTSSAKTFCQDLLSPSIPVSYLLVSDTVYATDEDFARTAISGDEFSEL
jgi:hypothetical protein